MPSFGLAGCTSVQRIVAEFIPKYASYCPTALEAAAKVVIKMHNCSLAIINNGEEVDAVAYKTAVLCIFGLADICQAASSEAPTSSVIQGICSAVFINVITFFVSSFEGKDLLHIVDKDTLNMQDSTKLFSEFKQKFLAEDESALIKLSKLRALSLLWIFFCCPKNSLAACFDLFTSAETEGIHNDGLYFLSQVTGALKANDGVSSMDDRSDVLSTDCKESGQSKNVTGNGLVSDGNHISENSSIVPKTCLLGLVYFSPSELRLLNYFVNKVSVMIVKLDHFLHTGSTLHKFLKAV